MDKPAAAWLNRLPLFIAIPYLLATYILFWLGPFDWPVREWWVPVIYVPACFFVLVLGYIVGQRGPGRVADMRLAPQFFAFGACAAAVLFVPTALTYTGKLPWDVREALTDQQAAYSVLADQLYATQGTRGPIAALRTLCGPLIFCVLPFGVMLWPQLSRVRKAATIAVVLISIDLSILRGTTRELADILVLGTSAYLIRVAAATQHGESGFFKAFARRWKGIFFAATVLVVVIVGLIGRTQERANGKMLTCIGYSQICADTTRGAYAHMSESFVFGIGTVTGYFSQGYYGLSLAAEKPFLSTYGLGHSPALSALAVNLGIDQEWFERGYTFRNGIDAWSAENQWSTMWAWIANDVGFSGALLITFAIGFVWGKSWADSIAGDLRAGLVFCLMMMTVFYAPANLQITLTFEGYATLLFWLILWCVGRGSRSASP